MSTYQQTHAGGLDVVEARGGVGGDLRLGALLQAVVVVPEAVQRGRAADEVHQIHHLLLQRAVRGLERGDALAQLALIHEQIGVLAVELLDARLLAVSRCLRALTVLHEPPLPPHLLLFVGGDVAALGDLLDVRFELSRGHVQQHLTR